MTKRAKLKLTVTLTKECSVCKRDLPFSGFGYLGGNLYMLDHQCSACRTEWYAMDWWPPSPIWLDPLTGAPRP